MTDASGIGISKRVKSKGSIGMLTSNYKEESSYSTRIDIFIYMYVCSNNFWVKVARELTMYYAEANFVKKHNCLFILMDNEGVDYQEQEGDN